MNPNRPRKSWPERTTQLLGIAFMLVLAALILHKSVADIARLAGLHSGKAFWRALARYFLANLGA